jgi:beta-phosphoglucomutase-like phosphatase (HAD superfamily)
MPLKAVFFDIDGTLVDSNEFHIMAWEEAFRESGHHVPKSHFIRSPKVVSPARVRQQLRGWPRLCHPGGADDFSCE